VCGQHKLSELEAVAGLRHHQLESENEHLRQQVTHLRGCLQAQHTRAEDVLLEHRTEEVLAQCVQQAFQREVNQARGWESRFSAEVEQFHAASRSSEESIAVLSNVSTAKYQLSEEMFGEQLSEQQAAHRVDRAEVRRLQKFLTEEREQSEQMRLRSVMYEKFLAEHAERQRELETQLRASRDDCERKRALIVKWREKCGASEARESTQEYEEARRRLQVAQRELVRKDAVINELRHECTEARLRQTQQKQREEKESARAGVDAARARALRTDTKRKEEALQHARSEVQILQKKLQVAQRKCEERDTHVRKLRSELGSVCGKLVEDQNHDSESRVSCPSSFDLSMVPLMEDSAFLESVNILNLGKEDLAQFFAQ